MPRSIGWLLPLGALACEPYDAFPEVTCGMADLTIDVTPDGFDPAEGTVPYGGQVRWENTDSEAHGVRDGDPSDEEPGLRFNSGMLEPGDSFCVEARESGDQPFFDDRGLGGVLTVEARPVGGGGGGGGGGGYGY